MSRINLLPWREQAKREQQRQFWLTFGVCATLSIIMMLGVQRYYHQLQAAQTGRNAFLQREIIILDQQIGEIREIQEQKKSLNERIGLIEALQLSRNLPTKMFNQFPLITPAGVYVDKFNYANQAISIEGRSEANYRVSNFMRNIELRDWLGMPDIKSIVALDTKNAKTNDGLELSTFNLHTSVILANTVEQGER